MSHKDHQLFFIKGYVLCVYTFSNIYTYSFWNSRFATMPSITTRFHYSFCSGGRSWDKAYHWLQNLYDGKKTFKHLEYLKCHNPTHFQPPTELQVGCADGPFDTYLYQTIPYRTFDQECYENITPSIRLFHLYEQGMKCDFYMVQLS